MKIVNVSILVAGIFFVGGCASVQMTREQVEGIRSAAARVLPPEVKVEVTTRSRFLAKPALIISAHLLEGHSPDERSPYVRGDYGTHEKLTRLVRYRCAKLLRSVVTGGQIPNVSKIVIEARHGVRQSYYGVPFGGTDVAMTIYVVSISISDVRTHNFSQIDEEGIMSFWKVEKNIIPSLDLRAVWF